MPVNFLRKRSIALCQDKIQASRTWLATHRYNAPNFYFHESVKLSLNEITLEEVADRIYDYVIDCVQKKDCEIDSILNLTRTRFAHLETLAHDDCTKKMLSDRLADITGRLFVLTMEAATKNLAHKNKSPASVTQSFDHQVETASSLTTWSTANVASTDTTRLTERMPLIFNQDGWRRNQTSETYSVEEAPQWNLTQSNITTNADSTAVEIDTINYPVYVGAIIHGLAGGTLACITERLGERFAEQYPTQRSTLIGLMKGFYLMGMASFPLLYASLESSFLQLDAEHTKESLQSSLFTFISSVLLQLVVDRAQQNGLGQSQIRRMVGHLIPLLACGWVFHAADKPVSALIAWALNLGAHMLSYAAWTCCLPARSSTRAVNPSQNSETPPLPTVATVDNHLFHVGTVHERGLQNPERMKARVLPQIVLPPETPAQISEPLYSEIDEFNPNRLGVEKQDVVTQEKLSEAGYIDMRATQERNPVPLPYSLSLLYAVPRKQPKPLQIDTDEQSEKTAYAFKA